MNLLAHVTARLKSLGVECSVVDAEIVIPTDTRPTRLRFEEGWEEAFKQYKKARSLIFDFETRCLVHNTSIEYVLVRLAPASQPVEYQSLKDAAGNVVNIGTASMIFAFAFFDSEEYEQYFRARVEKRLTILSFRRFTYLLWQPTTATYTAKGRKAPANLKEAGLSIIKNCLFKVAVEVHDCFAVWKPKGRRLRASYPDEKIDAHYPSV